MTIIIELIPIKKLSLISFCKCNTFVTRNGGNNNDINRLSIVAVVVIVKVLGVPG
jgi:hypothetical protein